MKISPYFTFSDTSQALGMYEKMGAKNVIKSLASDEMFADMPNRPHNNFIMNASFELFGSSFYASDTWDQKEVDQTATAVGIDFNANDEKELQQVREFMKLAQELGNKITMPLQKAEWGTLFGMVQDAQGISWMFNGAY